MTAQINGSGANRWPGADDPPGGSNLSFLPVPRYSPTAHFGEQSNFLQTGDAVVSPLPPRPPLQGPNLSPRVVVQRGGTQQCGCGESGVYRRCSWVLRNRQQSTGGHHVLTAGRRCSCASSRDGQWGHGGTWRWAAGRDHPLSTGLHDSACGKQPASCFLH